MPRTRIQPAERAGDKVPLCLPFGAYLRYVREKKGVTIKALAKLMGVTYQGLINTELSQTKEPMASTVIRAANALGIRPGKFLEDFIEFGRVYKLEEQEDDGR